MARWCAAGAVLIWVKLCMPTQCPIEIQEPLSGLHRKIQITDGVILYYHCVVHIHSACVILTFLVKGFLGTQICCV